MKRSPILRHAVTGGTGIYREQGSSSHSSLLDSADAALLSQFRPQTVNIVLPGSTTCPDLHLTSATYIPSTSQMVTASLHGHTGVSALHDCKWDWSEPNFEIPQGYGLAAFHSSITTVSVASFQDGVRVVAASSKSTSMAKLFFSTIPSPGAEDSSGFQPAGVYWNVGCADSSRIIAKMQPISGVTAVSLGDRISTVDQYGSFTGCNEYEYDNQEYRVGLDWLTNNIVAFESNSYSDNHCINLWDVRTDKGSVTRFKSKGRITGLINPHPVAANGHTDRHQVLASTNHRINVYDTRMPHSTNKLDLPLLSFQHVHQGPELDFTTDGKNLIAAVDRDNVVQIFSMRTGRKRESLIAPQLKSSFTGGQMMKKLQWYDDTQGGSTLHACVGNSVVRWSWGGSRNDDNG